MYRSSLARQGLFGGSLPVIPSLKLTDKGLMDVDAFKLIDVRAS